MMGFPWAESMEMGKAPCIQNATWSLPRGTATVALQYGLQFFRVILLLKACSIELKISWAIEASLT